MAFASRGVTSAEILAAIIDDSTRFHGASIAAILTKASIDKYSVFEVWSDPVDTFSITNTPGDKTLNDVVIPDLGTYTIIAAYARIKILQIADDSASENRLTAATHIQVDKAAAGYINAIRICENAIRIVGSSQDMHYFDVIGNLDIAARVANNATTNFKWTSAVCSAATMYCRATQTGLRLLLKGA